MDEELEISLKDIFAIIREKIWLIVIITIGFTLIAGLISFFVIKPTYESKISVIVGKPQTTQDITSQQSSATMYQNLLKTYSQIAQSDLVAQGALDKLHSNLTLEGIKGAITVTPQDETQILVISAKSKSSEEAFNIINAVTNSFIQSSKKVYPTGGDIQIMDKAIMPTVPTSPNKKLNMAVGFLLGLMISVGIVLLLEYSDNTIKTESDVDKYIDLPVLGVIPKMTENIN